MSKNIKLNVGKDITIEQGFERFLRWCRLKGFSEYTIEFYDEIRMNFARFKNLDEPIEDLNKELFEEYILFLQKTDVTSVTLFIYAKGLKRVCNYFMDEELIEPFVIELTSFSYAERYDSNEDSSMSFWQPVKNDIMITHQHIKT